MRRMSNNQENTNLNACTSSKDNIITLLPELELYHHETPSQTSNHKQQGYVLFLPCTYQLLPTQNISKTGRTIQNVQGTIKQET